MYEKSSVVEIIVIFAQVKLACFLATTSIVVTTSLLCCLFLTLKSLSRKTRLKLETIIIQDRKPSQIKLTTHRLNLKIYLKLFTERGGT